MVFLLEHVKDLQISLMYLLKTYILNQEGYETNTKRNSADLKTSIKWDGYSLVKTYFTLEKVTFFWIIW